MCRLPWRSDTRGSPRDVTRVSSLGSLHRSCTPPLFGRAPVTEITTAGTRASTPLGGTVLVAPTVQVGIPRERARLRGARQVTDRGAGAFRIGDADNKANSWLESEEGTPFAAY